MASLHGGAGVVREGNAAVRRQVPEQITITRILGLDPGTRVAGYGLVDAAGSRFSLVEAGVLKATPGAPLARRLAEISVGLREVVARRRPQTAAVEDVFVKVDPRAALFVGHARGAMLSVMGEAELEVASYPPASVKRAVAGNGRAGKAQVAKMVGAILHLASVVEPTDASDALAVAIAHALQLRSQLTTEQ